MIRECRLGIDVGSTTVKVALLEEGGRLLYGRYERHRSDVAGALASMLEETSSRLDELRPGAAISVMVTGSAGIGVARRLGLEFVQEVSACARAIEELLPETDVAIELGGEDAKITYFGASIEERMNGSCAGGTGAFIDQMASLLGTDPAGLDALAAGAQTIYPIASRCGVFAKADVQPLVNEGARREDIAASVFQAVVNQTISGLACGRPIRGRVALLGGPLHYLGELRRRFGLTLKLQPGSMLVPQDGRLFVAMGAALSLDALEAPGPGRAATSRRRFSGKDLRALAKAVCDPVRAARQSPGLEPLFADEGELAAFRARHAAASLPRAELAGHGGPVFVGIDAGSTTSKLVALDGEGRLLFGFYANNGGHPLEVVARGLEGLYAAMPDSAFVASSCATGYGEGLVRAGLGADHGEVETVAHSMAAAALAPGVEAVLDIGGQDMKFLRMKDGVITTILLNEACSSGCGSFLETFARSMGRSAEDFAALALESREPVDLGSRCTVFMNSRVKQAQKEGASPADIAAGLAYSVVKNTLQKVIRVRDPRELGERIVVQGGTFASEAVLRAFELVSGREATRPAEAGLMGAYGAALVARNRWRGKATHGTAACGAGAGGESAGEESRSGLSGPADLASFSSRTESARCPGCGNACLLTITRFDGGQRAGHAHVTGNRCERGAALAAARDDGAQATGSRDAAPGSAAEGKAQPHARRDLPPDLYAWKHARLFRYEPLAEAAAPRGRMGIPRVLNLYENYPFWFTLFTALGFRVELSPRSSRTLYELGMESIPSESVCYPAKLVHGHATQLVRSGTPLVFYPCVPKEERFVEGSDNCFNCPIVTSYPEVVLNNVEGLRLMPDGSTVPAVTYLDPFLPIADDGRLAGRLVEELGAWKVRPDEAKRAVRAAREEEAAYREELRAEGEKALDWIEKRGRHGIVLAGRPYHVDPEVHHGIPQVITELGMAVISEDAIAHLGLVDRPLRVVDQWAYHSRLYAAATFVSRRDDLDLVQLTSFGCGLDAVTSDQVAEILARTGKVYTTMKIDEHANLGAARIRLRSLAAAIEEREGAGRRSHAPDPQPARPVFGADMRPRYTILAPQMAPVQFEVVEEAFRASGYDFEVLKAAGREAIDEGLRSVHNDACFPSIIVTGQLLSALRSGKYDLARTALLITQTGGGCRATNYIGFIRKALTDADLGHVPVISLSAQGIESSPGFRLTPALLYRGVMACSAGDLVSRLLLRCRPYEAAPGSADRLAREWLVKARELMHRPSPWRYAAFCRDAVAAFDALPLLGAARRPRIGVVGEILVKFHPGANGDIVGAIEAEGAEAVVPDLYGFLLYCCYNAVFRRKKLSGGLAAELGSRLAIAALELLRAPANRALGKSTRFEAPPRIGHLAASVEGIVQLGNCTGEGWFLTAEMLELIEGGTDGIACLQPFACLPNHVTGKGVLKELRRRHPEVPIAAIDFDPGTSEVNQENRLKLLIDNARRGRRRGASPASAEAGMARRAQGVAGHEDKPERGNDSSEEIA
jgi:predicted CoA-substrate-specific enzyme activase